MKKVARADVIAKFAEAMAVCPPKLLADLEDAMATYVAGDRVTASAHLERTETKARKRKFPKRPRTPIGEGSIDTNYREFK